MKTSWKQNGKKSNLILEANLLKTQGQHQEAANRLAAAAHIEEQLSEKLLQQALKRKYFVHRFSALSGNSFVETQDFASLFPRCPVDLVSHERMGYVRS